MSQVLNVLRLTMSRLGTHVCPNGHDVPPSIATQAARPGHTSRTQAVKAAWKRAGLMRFIRMVSQRPPGTPCS